MPLIFKDKFESILLRGSEYMGLDELDLVRRAYEFTIECGKWKNQLRKSGEPFIIHPLAVADQLVRWRLDAPTIAAGILHDIIEDQNIHALQLRAAFTDQVALLVDGVTKLRKFELPDETDADSAYYYKVFLAVADDVRVALIKIADRLHNMSTLEFLPLPKQAKKSKETERIFIPLTAFLGMEAAMEMMTDLSLQFGSPAEYSAIMNYISSVIEDEDKFFEEVIEKTKSELLLLEIPPRVHRFRYSISHTKYLLEKETGPSFPKTGLVEITVPEEADCYLALRALHRGFQGLSNGFQDTIHFPSVDMKRMIETSLLAASGKQFIARIVSSEMRKVNRWGVVPYLAAPNELARTDFLVERLVEIRSIIENVRKEKGIGKQGAQVDNITRDLLQKKIFVIVGGGKRIELPEGSTVLDFAYKMDRIIGDHFHHATLNGKEVPINTVPTGCDLLQIVTDENVMPQVSWLLNSNTRSTRTLIKKKLSEQSPEQAYQAGRSALIEQFNAFKFTFAGSVEEMEFLLSPIITFMGVPDKKTFYEKIGYGELLAKDVVEALREQFKRNAFISEAELEPVIFDHPAFVRKYPLSIISLDRQIRGELTLCETCLPMPGDQIEANIFSRRAIVHKKHCKKQFRSFVRVRPVPCAWDKTDESSFLSRIKVKSFSSEAIHQDILQLVGTHGIHYISSQVRLQCADGLELMEFLLEVKDISTLNNVCNAILGMKDVIVAMKI